MGNANERVSSSFPGSMRTRYVMCHCWVTGSRRQISLCTSIPITSRSVLGSIHHCFPPPDIHAWKSPPPLLFCIPNSRRRSHTHCWRPPPPEKTSLPAPALPYPTATPLPLLYTRTQFLLPFLHRPFNILSHSNLHHSLEL